MLTTSKINLAKVNIFKDKFSKSQHILDGTAVTGIVLVVEMTMNYALILPLIVTCFSATIAAIFMGGSPIYSTLLSRTLVLAKRKKLYLSFKKRKNRSL
ncbi:hypothetical protein [Cysteiniphilum sp. 19S12-1]|uniref:hypothetical protein n=1 Tax=Cysteiniphilum sp. 19S12-1 TaxID=3453130 RepID=UPI003F82E037